jgi:hypothetical protein
VLLNITEKEHQRKRSEKQKRRAVKENPHIFLRAAGKYVYGTIRAK